MSVTEPAFRPDVNVSIATGNGRFSAVDQWPVLGVHRGNGLLHGYEIKSDRDSLRRLATQVDVYGKGAELVVV